MRGQQDTIKRDQQQIKADQIAMRENMGKLITVEHLIEADQAIIKEELSHAKEEMVQINWDIQEIRTAQQVFKEQLLRIKEGQAILKDMLKSLNSI